MRSTRGTAILTALLYGQALFGLVAVGAVLIKDRTEQTALVDRMTVASVTNDQNGVAR